MLYYNGGGIMIAYLSAGHELTMLRLNNIILAFKPEKLVNTYTEVDSFDSVNYLLKVSGEDLETGNIASTSLDLNSVFRNLHASRAFLEQITDVQLEP